MKHIKTYKIFEFNRKDINIINAISDKFTVSFEFELECNDDKLYDNSTEEMIINDFIIKIKKEIENKNINYIDYKDYIYQFLHIIDFIQWDDEKILSKIEPKKSMKGDKLEIHYIMYNIIEEYLDEKEDDRDDYEGIDYLKGKVYEKLPNLAIKYGDDFKYEFDRSLRKGVEFSFKTYIVGINNGIEVLKVFFNDFDNQDYFFMNERTSIHINLGLIDSDVKWNPLKGVIMLNDADQDSIPFVYKDMIWRMNNNFCGSIIQKLLNLKMDVSELNFDNAEDFLIPKIKKFFEGHGEKAFGVNLNKLFTYGYVEFRYVGGKLTKDIMINKLMYFAYIVHLMTSDYKNKDYDKKLYKFIDRLKS